MKPTAEDLKKIETYRATLGKYEKPSVTADIIAVRPALGELREDQWRENPKFALEILLIGRGFWPYEGCWALPGGFIQGKNSETVEEGLHANSWRRQGSKPVTSFRSVSFQIRNATFALG